MTSRRSISPLDICFLQHHCLVFSTEEERFVQFPSDFFAFYLRGSSFQFIQRSRIARRVCSPVSPVLSASPFFFAVFPLPRFHCSPALRFFKRIKPEFPVTDILICLCIFSPVQRVSFFLLSLDFSFPARSSASFFCPFQDSSVASLSSNPRQTLLPTLRFLPVLLPLSPCIRFTFFSDSHSDSVFSPSENQSSPHLTTSFPPSPGRSKLICFLDLVKFFRVLFRVIFFCQSCIRFPNFSSCASRHQL